MNHTLKEWIDLAEGSSLAEAAIQAQMKHSGMDRDQVRRQMGLRLTAMREAVAAGMDATLKSVSGLTGGQAAKMKACLMGGHSLCGSLLGRAETYAMATAECNACMGKIVAAPTAGACGILPGTLLAMMDERGVTEDQAIDALFVAGAVAESIASAASISGAEGGCQAECGSASAMAAAVLVYLCGGTPKMSMDAAAFSLMNLLGLVCDPVGGLVEVPCVYRNVGSTGVAFTSADMVMSGLVNPLDPDEVILAMKEVGDALPATLRETGDGGCAACPSACLACRRKQ